MAFEAILSRQGANAAAPGKWRSLTLTFSVLVHALALAFGVAHSVWRVVEMPLPEVQVTLAVAPPPPPPPATQRSKTKQKSKVQKRAVNAVSVPQETAKSRPEPAADTSSDDTSEAAKDDGKEGGAEGGVPGGMGSGAAPLPSVKSTGPKQLSARAGNQLLDINPNERRYRVNVPEELSERMSAGDKISPVLDICVTAQGTVRSVTIVRASQPTIDVQIPSVIARWRYKPYLIDGQPQPFCYLTKYSLTTH
ncbi:MAG: hypothetical protein RL033_3571 [Pseudomonadota bacterium]|jgi:hypothetical protein